MYKHKIEGVILENTFTNIADMIDAIMPVFKFVKFLQKNFWNSIENIGKISKSILFIRCIKDELVPTSQMQKLIRNIDPNTYYEEY